MFILVEATVESHVQQAMNAIAESPRPYFTNPAAARQAGINSAISRRANAAKLVHLTNLLPEILTKAKQRAEQIESQPTHVSARLALLESHIARLDIALGECDKPSDWRDLSMARERLFNQWAHLAGIPKPMAAREVRTTRRVIQAPAAPIELPPVG